LRWFAVACAVAAASTACSSNSTSSAPSKPAAASSAEPTSGAAAEHQIATNWTTFFDPKTPVSQRIALLQDGQTFASVIQAQAGSSLASQASAAVSKVAVSNPSQASVSYSILLGGNPALPNQSGTAVYQSGTWKVAVASFCGLLALEAGGSTAALPAACKTAQ
jgi:hypothetical protein